MQRSLRHKPLSVAVSQAIHGNPEMVYFYEKIPELNIIRPYSVSALVTDHFTGKTLWLTDRDASLEVNYHTGHIEFNRGLFKGRSATVSIEYSPGAFQ